MSEVQFGLVVAQLGLARVLFGLVVAQFGLAGGNLDWLEASSSFPQELDNDSSVRGCIFLVSSK